MLRKPRAVLAFVLLVAMLCAQSFTAYAASGLGAIYLTDSADSSNNVTHFAKISDAYLIGGPDKTKSFTDGATYYVKVTTTNDDTPLGSAFTVVPADGGKFSACLSAIGVELTASPPQYKVWVSTGNTFKNSESMTQAFSIGGGSTGATVTVSKAIYGEGFSDTQLFDVQIQGSTGSPLTGQVSVAQSQSFGLAPGTYTISEVNVPSGYNYLTTLPSQTFTVTAGQSLAITLVNTYGPKGTLTINKTLTGAAGSNIDQEFDISVTGGGQTLTGHVTARTPWVIPNLPIGTYTVTETGSVPGYTYVSGNGTVTLTTAGATKTITNSYGGPTGHLTITKAVTPSNANQAQSFTVTVTPTSGTATTHTLTVASPVELDLPYGTYTVQETNIPTGYTPSMFPTNGLVTVSATPASVTINNHFNQPPVAVTDSYSVNKNGTLSLTISGLTANDSDPNFDTFWVTTFTSAPLHGSLSVVSDGAFTYSPNPNYVGLDQFTYEISDAHGEKATTTVNLTISETHGTLRLTKVTTGDFSGGPVTSFTVVITPDAGTALTRTVAVGTPLEISLPFGWYTISENPIPDGYSPIMDPLNGRVQVTSALATVTITNNYVHANQAPVAVDDDFTINMNESIGLWASTLMTDDSDPDHDNIYWVGIVSGSGPSHGSLVAGSNGAYTYTPTTDYFGPDQYTYEIRDEHGLTDTALVTITIVRPNRPPVADDETYTTTKNVAKKIVITDLLTGDTDPDEDFIYFASNTNPSHGTLVILETEPGIFTYTPTTDYTGPDSFTYTIRDEHGLTDVGTVSITVTDPSVQTATLYVKKIVDAGGGTAPAPTNFWVDIYNAETNVKVDGGWITPATVIGVPFTLPLGTYYVVENTTDKMPANYVFDSLGYPDGETAHVHLGANGATVTVVNDYRPAQLTIVKLVEGAGDVDVSNYAFWVRIASKTSSQVYGGWVKPGANQAVTFDVLPGEYIVSETEMGSQFHFDHVTYPGDGGNWVCTNPADGWVELGYAGDTATVTVVNHYNSQQPQTGTLTIHKHLTGDAGSNPDLDFNVRVTPAQQYSITAVEPEYFTGTVSANGNWTLQLPPGEYRVEELTPLPSRYTAVSISVNVPDSEGVSRLAVEGGLSAYVHVYADLTSTVTMTNRYTAPYNPPPPPTNNPPVAIDDSGSTSGTTPIVIGVLPNDYDADGDLLTVISTTNPANGAIVVNGNQITYTPNAGFSGSDSFTYTISDGQGGTATATVRVTVDEIVIPDEPIPGGPADLPKTGGVNPLIYTGLGLALVAVGATFRKRK